MYLNVTLAVRNCPFAEIVMPRNMLNMGMLNARGSNAARRP
jgi:hypothetical protein